MLAVPVGKGGVDESLINPLAVAGIAPAAVEVDAFLRSTRRPESAGALNVLPRPGGAPDRLLFVGVGDADESGWRAAGGAVVRAAARDREAIVVTHPGIAPDAVRGLVEGLRLGGYRYHLGREDPDRPRNLRRIGVAVDDPDRLATAAASAESVAEATALARDLTNTPSEQKSPAWFASQIERAVVNGPAGLAVTVRDPERLEAEGFGGILAVGGGSTRGPRLVELSWQPRGAKLHVVLVGKGITFDTGGICIKSRDGMKLMRKDMGGAAAVLAAVIGAARLGLRVRLTALAPLAENMVSGSAYRPGDVVRHYGGMTSEILNTDAEGRVVLADALSYADRRLRPDLLVDLATLTGANAVALGKRTAALYSDNDSLAADLSRAAAAAGERVWRMPLANDYLELFASPIADVANSGYGGPGPGSVTAALYLREFAGGCRDRWAHMDMSAPSWSDTNDGELVKGATGWGVRTLLRWLTFLAADSAPARPTGADSTPLEARRSETASA